MIRWVVGLKHMQASRSGSLGTWDYGSKIRR